MSNRENSSPNLGRHAASGAVAAAMVGALWVMHYLLTATYGHTTDTVVGRIDVPIPLWEYIVGQYSNLGAFAAEALFIVVTRFLLAFSVSWAVLTVGTSFLDFLGYAIRKAFNRS